MISDQLKDNLIEEIVKGLIEQGPNGLKPVIELLFNSAMKIEREHFLGAAPHQKTEERKGYANGYKPREFQTRLGTLELEVPQVRGLKFYPQCLEKGSRSEKNCVLKMKLYCLAQHMLKIPTFSCFSIFSSIAVKYCGLVCQICATK